MPQRLRNLIHLSQHIKKNFVNDVLNEEIRNKSL